MNKETGSFAVLAVEPWLSIHGRKQIPCGCQECSSVHVNTVVRDNEPQFLKRGVLQLFFRHGSRQTTQLLCEIRLSAEL